VIVLGTERDADRLALATELGADHVPRGTHPTRSGGAGADRRPGRRPGGDLAPGAVSTVVDAIGMAGTRARVLLAASKHGTR